MLHDLWQHGCQGTTKESKEKQGAFGGFQPSGLPHTWNLEKEANLDCLSAESGTCGETQLIMSHVSDSPAGKVLQILKQRQEIRGHPRDHQSRAPSLCGWVS